jgi:hypothetical protein
MLVYCLALCLTLKTEAIYPSKISIICSRLYGVISLKTVILLICRVKEIYEVTQLGRSILKRRNVPILRDILIVNNRITFALHVPPCSLVDTCQLVGDPAHGNIKNRFLRNFGTSLKRQGKLNCNCQEQVTWLANVPLIVLTATVPLTTLEAPRVCQQQCSSVFVTLPKIISNSALCYS